MNAVTVQTFLPSKSGEEIFPCFKYSHPWCKYLQLGIEWNPFIRNDNDLDNYNPFMWDLDSWPHLWPSHAHVEPCICLFIPLFCYSLT